MKDTKWTYPDLISTSVIPVHQDVQYYHLSPDRAEFFGRTAIDLSIREPINQIKLHAQGLQFSESFVTRGGVDGVPASIVHAIATLDEHCGGVTLDLPAYICGDEWRLVIRFSGWMNEKLCGWQRGCWQDADGAEHWIAGVRLEPMEAKWAFPCFGEPTFAATSSVSLTVPDHYAVISNGALVREMVDEPGWKQLMFSSDRMSDYLFFVVGEFVLPNQKGVPSCRCCQLTRLWFDLEVGNDGSNGLWFHELFANYRAFLRMEAHNHL